MKVHELIALLKKCDPDAGVIVEGYDSDGDECLGDVLSIKKIFFDGPSNKHVIIKNGLMEGGN